MTTATTRKRTRQIENNRREQRYEAESIAMGESGERLLITITADIGTKLETAIEKAIRTALAVGHPVLVDFNETVIVVRESDDVESATSRWHIAYEQNFREVS